MVPDAPIDLTNDPETTSDSIVRFTWSDGASNGGTSILDYAVYFANGSGGLFTLLSSTVTAREFVHVTITAGNLYRFKVTARNTVGSSFYSEVLEILAA